MLERIMVAARESHHIRANKHWTFAEEKILTQLWGTASAAQIAKRMGRSVDSIMSRALRMKLGSASRGSKSLAQFCRETGYHPNQIRYAIKNLGMAIQHKIDTRHPKEKRIYRQYAITFEQEEAVLEYLSKHPDGERVYCHQPGHRTKVGQWGVGNKPPACLDCKRTDRAHRGHGLCGTCHMRLVRRRNKQT